MNLEQKLKEHQYESIWKEYCGFLDLNIEEYMLIQKRLMEEQIQLWSNCDLGKAILKGKRPKSLEEFREMVPLTTYDDYADVLLNRRAEMLPGNPITWIQTTWEGGKHPVKVAPYTRNMLDTYRNNVVACLLLSTSTKKGEFDVSTADKFLYGLAPMPYMTGLFPLALREDIRMRFLPEIDEAVNMTFSQRNKLGFKMAMKEDVEFFFGLGSVAHAVSVSFGNFGGASGKISSLLKCKPKMIYRILKAKIKCKKEQRPLMPKDLFRLKGFMVAGTDNRCYKDDLERLWGVRPMELFAGTEPSIIGTETWTRNGMYFFPDTCFYEFILERDMYRMIEDPSYQPKTYLMDEVIPGEKYELVITVLKGGAFARYRVGDMYRCVGLTNKEDNTKIPRFEYIDRVPGIIDIAGFTRISENGIRNAIELSGLPLKDWVAVKEYNEENRPYLHLYVEIATVELIGRAMSTEILKEVLTTYFKYIDHDYADLKKIIGMDPLKVSILKRGSFASYEARNGKKIQNMSPIFFELKDLLQE